MELIEIAKLYRSLNYEKEKNSEKTSVSSDTLEDSSGFKDEEIESIVSDSLSFENHKAEENLKNILLVENTSQSKNIKRKLFLAKYSVVKNKNFKIKNENKTKDSGINYGPDNFKVKLESMSIEQISKELEKKIFQYFINYNYHKKVRGDKRRNKKAIAKHYSLDLLHLIPKDMNAFYERPVAFVFDISGSNEPSIKMYAGIVNKLIRKGVIVYFCYNDTIYSKITVNSNSKRGDLWDLRHKQIYKSPTNINGFSIWSEHADIDKIIKRDNIERVVVFTDFDAINSMISTSEISDTFWMSTSRRNYGSYNFSPDIRRKLLEFKGHYANIESPKDLLKYFYHFGDKNYENREKNKYFKDIYTMETLFGEES